jgi:hypothetical protein
MEQNHSEQNGNLTMTDSLAALASLALLSGAAAFVLWQFYAFRGAIRAALAGHAGRASIAIDPAPAALVLAFPCPRPASATLRLAA